MTGATLHMALAVVSMLLVSLAFAALAVTGGTRS